MECYLDNAATTKPFSEVCDLVTRVMYEDFGNPSSLHMKGVIAERYVRQAREQIAKTLKCAAKNIVFTRDRKSTRLNSSHPSSSRMPSSA